jgi:hypothetical protein
LTPLAVIRSARPAHRRSEISTRAVAGARAARINPSVKTCCNIASQIPWGRTGDAKTLDVWERTRTLTSVRARYQLVFAVRSRSGIFSPVHLEATLDHLLSFTGLALAALGRPACFVSTWAEATAAGRCLAGHGCSPLIATNPRTLYSTVRSKTSSNATRCAGRAHRGNPETIITAGVCGSQPQVGCCRLGHFKLPIPVYPRSADAPGWHRISAFVPAPDSRK